jgi:hypothetical protein
LPFTKQYNQTLDGSGIGLRSPAGEKAKSPTKEDSPIPKERCAKGDPKQSKRFIEAARAAGADGMQAGADLAFKRMAPSKRQVGIPRSSELNPECLAASSESFGKPAVTRARRLVRTRHEQVL